MKQLFSYSILILTMCFFTPNIGEAQLKIDWKEYKEPDGKIWFINLNPLTNIWERRDLSLRSSLSYRNLKNLSIINSSAYLSYTNRLNEDDEVTNFISFSPDLDYTKYISKRRGLFVGTKNDIFYSKSITLNSSDRLSSINSIEIGFGRIEEVSTVMQSMRILNNIEELSPQFDAQSQTEIFNLATLLRELDYYYERDSRIRIIKRTEAFLTYFKDRSIDLNDTYTTAQLIDGFNYSRRRPFISGIGTVGSSFSPSNLENLILNLSDDPIGDFHFGQKISFGLEHWREGIGESQNLAATSLKLDMMKSFALSNTIRTNIYAQTNYFLNSQNLEHAYRFGISGYYTPDARTNITLAFQYKGVANEFDDLKYLQINASASYFITYKTVLTGLLRFYNTDSFEQRNNNFYLALNHYFY